MHVWTECFQAIAFKLCIWNWTGAYINQRQVTGKYIQQTVLVLVYKLCILSYTRNSVPQKSRFT